MNLFHFDIQNFYGRARQDRFFEKACFVVILTLKASLKS